MVLPDLNVELSGASAGGDRPTTLPLPDMDDAGAPICSSDSPTVTWSASCSNHPARYPGCCWRMS